MIESKAVSGKSGYAAGSQRVFNVIAVLTAMVLGMPVEGMAGNYDGQDASGIQAIGDIVEMATSAPAASAPAGEPVPYIFRPGEDASGFQSVEDIAAHARWADGVETRNLAKSGQGDRG